MALFELPETRSSKSNDKSIVKKSSSKKSAPMQVRGGGMFERIATINSLVESKIGKYKDDYVYYMKGDEERLKEYAADIIKNCRCSIDTETTGLDTIDDTLVGLSLYTKGQKALYIPVHHKSYITGVETDNQLSSKFISEILSELLFNNVKFVMHNAKFDIQMLLKEFGVYIPCWFDTILAGNCLNENEPHGLKALHSKYVLGGREDEFSFGKYFEGVTFDMIPIKTGYIYAARDAIDTEELCDFQLPYLDPNNELCKECDLEGVSNVFWNIEMPYVDVIVSLEQTGITLDVKYAHELSEKYHKLLDEKLSEFYRLLGMYQDKIDAYIIKNPNHKLSDPISVSSPTQLAILFYDILGIEPVDKKKPRGTGEEILEKIDNPLCKAILEYRGVEKLLSTYIDKMPECVHADGRVHCSFNQYGAKTGRLSSDNPNLQNIPSHNKDIRKMFTAKDGYVLLSSDYSQQEPKCMTAMCKDPAMIQAYKEGKDLYASIASLAFNKPYEDCLEFRPDGTTNKDGKERRSQAKTILLGILYGRGINSVAEQLHCSKTKAQQIQDKIFKGFPAIAKFENDSKVMAQEEGYVTTFWGRKRRLPEMQLPEYEFKYKEGYGDTDPLDFTSEVIDLEVPDDVKRKYTNKLNKLWGDKKRKVYEEALNDGIIITDNGGKIADATRQTVNARIQGSAADMSKLAGREIYDNERLKELGFKLLIPIHDEYLAECPKENAKECAKLFADCMSKAAEPLGLPISCDVAVSQCWYGDEIKL